MMCLGDSLVGALLPHVSTYDGTRLLLKGGFLLAPALLLAAAGNVLPLANVSRGSWERARVHAKKKSGTICRGPMTGGHF